MRPRPGRGVRDASARASDAAVEHGRAPGRTMLPGGEEMTRRSDRPEIVADAARTILTRPSRACADRVFIDDEVLVAAGVGALDACACAPGAGHEPDILGEPWEGAGAT
ncbi:MAG: hypothetical protein VYD87_03300 [Pseudomonadota bacterium]|nr:hypothetical protein [Pseudomonadota bacterium]